MQPSATLVQPSSAGMWELPLPLAKIPEYHGSLKIADYCFQSLFVPSSPSLEYRYNKFWDLLEELIKKYQDSQRQISRPPLSKSIMLQSWIYETALWNLRAACGFADWIKRLPSVVIHHHLLVKIHFLHPRKKYVLKIMLCFKSTRPRGAGAEIRTQIHDP